MLGDVVLPADGQREVLVHGDSPNTDDNRIEDNGNFDKIDPHSTNKMHTVHFLVEMDRCQAKQTAPCFSLFIPQKSSQVYENNHSWYQLHLQPLLAYNYANHKTTLCLFLQQQLILTSDLHIEIDLPVGYPYLSVFTCAIDTAPNTLHMIVPKLNALILPCSGETKIVRDQSLYVVSPAERFSWFIT